MARFWFACAAAWAMVAAVPVVAHHSTSMFDVARQATLVGRIKSFQWTNPHAWIQVTVTGTGGETVEWSIECSSPNTLSRQGWKPTTFTPGDQVTVVANPMKDGTHAALLVTVTLPDGRILGPGALAAR